MTHEHEDDAEECLDLLEEAWAATPGARGVDGVGAEARAGAAAGRGGRPADGEIYSHL